MAPVQKRVFHFENAKFRKRCADADDKDAANTQKATKLAFNIFMTYLILFITCVAIASFKLSILFLFFFIFLRVLDTRPLRGQLHKLQAALRSLRLSLQSPLEGSSYPPGKLVFTPSWNISIHFTR